MFGVVEFEKRSQKKTEKTAEGPTEDADLDEAVRYFQENGFDSDGGDDMNEEDAGDDGEEEIPGAQIRKRGSRTSADDMDVDEEPEGNHDIDSQVDAAEGAADDEDDFVLQGSKFDRQAQLAAISAMEDIEGEEADLVDMDAEAFMNDSEDESPKKRKRQQSGKKAVNADQKKSKLANGEPSRKQKESKRNPKSGKK